MMLSLILIVIVIASIFLFVKKRLNFWKDKGVQIPKDYTKIMRRLLTQKCSILDSWKHIYEEFKTQGLRHGGMFMLLTPNYVPIDLEIVKAIMQVDFQHFVDRGVYVNEEGDPLSAHLFSLSGNKWKLLRQKLTPTFTSGKMKMMFDTLVDCTNGLYKAMDNENIHAVDVKDLLARFTTDIIGSCAFGLNCNTLENPDNDFRKYAKAFFRSNIMRNLKIFLIIAAPNFMLKFNMKIIPVDVSDFFMGVVRDTISYREKNNIYRKDFMHLLIQLKNRGKLVDDEGLFEEDITENDNKITFEEIAAQAFVFYLGGFETSSTTMTFCLYELAKNKEIQEKVRDEIRTVLKKHNGKLTYDALAEMHYLEQTISEALRKYPPLSILERICTQEFQVPGTDLVLEKGQKVIIPVIGIHYDPEYYPKPEVFDPDRFSDENKKTRPAFAFLPFGEGPRACIGLRFGKLQTKVGIIALLSSYEISVNEKTKEPLEFDSTSFVTSTKGGMWLDFEKISSDTINFSSNKNQ